MAEFSTLQQLTGAAAQNMAKENPFENLATGFRQGQQDARSLMQRQIEMQRMQIEAGFKKQELDQKLDGMRVGSLKDIFQSEDPVAQKVLIDNHDEMAKKYGWKDDNLLKFAKSADARQAFRDKFDPTRAGDPQYLSEFARGLASLGDDPQKIHKFIQTVSDPAQKQANIKLMADERIKSAKAKSMDTVIDAATKVGAVSPEDQAILRDPDKQGTPEWFDAFNRSAMNYGKKNQETQNIKNQKTIADTQKSKQAAGEGGMSTKKEDTILSNLQKTPSYSKLQETIEQLERVRSSAQSGGNRLDLQEALGGTFRAITNSARAASNASDKKELSTAAKQLGNLMTYFSGKREINPNDQEFKDLQGLIDRVETSAKGAQKNLAKQFLKGAIGGGQIRQNVAGGWYKGRFGEEFDGSAGSAPAGGQGNGGQFTVGGKQFTEDQLRQQAMSAKDPEKAKAMFKQITGKDL